MAVVMMMGIRECVEVLIAAFFAALTASHMCPVLRVMWQDAARIIAVRTGDAPPCD
ncbi:MAG: hypothetical protein Q7T01_00765 [bacterium]|nr:hypothetical protein [bacterium]